MPVKGRFTGSCKVNPGPATIPNPNPRHKAPGYAGRVEARKIQSGPASPAKRVKILVGRSNPPAPGVGRDREKMWEGTYREIPNEIRMEHRGCRR